MKKILLCSILASMAGCASAKTTADFAREAEPRCADVSDDSVARVVSAKAIDSVQPAYSYVLGGPNGRQARLRGAQIHVRPQGLTKESVATSLECHQARVALGQSALKASDPYTLPDRWLDIDVDSDRSGFLVLVRTDDTDDAQQVLDRARVFATARD